MAYLLITFVVTFFAAALVAGARERLTGGQPDAGLRLLRRLAAPARDLPVVAAHRHRRPGPQRHREPRVAPGAAWSSRAIGMTWQIVTWLAVPVIVAEGTGPITSLKRSAGLFRQTWGENLVGQIGFGLIGLLAMLPGLVIAGLLMVTCPVAGIVVGSCGWPACRWSSPP